MKLYISDLDGTLLNSDIVVSDFTVKTLNKLISQGLQFSVATARTYATAGKILKDIDLRLPIILMNGVLIFNPTTKKYDVINRLDERLCRVINETRKSMGLECFMYTITDDSMMTYYEKLSNKAMLDFYNERMAKYYKSFTQVNDFDSVNTDKIYFTFIDTYEKLSPLYNKLSEINEIYMTFYKDIYSENLWYLEILSAAASKKNAVLWLKEHYGFDSAAAFGDNLNDLPMFEVCEEKYAVKNANQKVIEKCNKVIETNNDDGVAKFLQSEWKGK